MSSAEASTTFACFGATCAAFVIGAGPQGRPAQAVASAQQRLLHWHGVFSRFEPASELSALNRDPRAEVPVSPLMADFVAAASEAARATEGLVDATLLAAIERAGYRSSLSAPLPLKLALVMARGRSAGAPDPAARWRQLRVDRAAGTVTRPPGLGLDSGGLVKGMAADELAGALADHDAFAIDCAGDLRIGGAAGLSRTVKVANPFGGAALHAFEIAAGAVATSGIGRRSWLGEDGRPAHHLLDPATGRPAFTGVVQVTALAPTALEAEIRAKAAILSGPAGARSWLPDGGVVVFDDGAHECVAGGQPSGRWQTASMLCPSGSSTNAP